jgi:CBS-domain-containing membrane protein
MTHATANPTQHVYRGCGDRSIYVPHRDRADADTPRIPNIPSIPTIADMVPATWIMTRAVICAREDLEVSKVMDLMVEHHIGSIPVVDADGRPVGMVTKLDVLEYTIAARDPECSPATTLSRMMMPLALTLDVHATVAHVAAMMAIEDVHHVPIVAEDGTLVGVISTMDVVRWLASNDGFVNTGSES